MSAYRQFLEDIQQFPDFRDDPKLAMDRVLKMQAGDSESESNLIASVLKYVVELTSAHCRTWDAWANREDLIQEASKVISAKISKFNPEKASLEDFVRFCSRTAFIRFWYNLKCVHISESRRKLISRIRRAYQKLSEELGREPTLEEVGECVDIDEDRIQEISSNSTVSLIDIDDSFSDEPASNVFTFPSLISKVKSPLQMAEIAEFRRLTVEAIGPTDSDLLLAYEDYDTAHVQALFLIAYGKHIKEDALRKRMERLRTKVSKYIRRHGRRPL